MIKTKGLSFSVRLGLLIFGICVSLFLGMSWMLYTKIQEILWLEVKGRLQDITHLSSVNLSSKQISYLLSLIQTLETEFPLDTSQHSSQKEGSNSSVIPKDRLNALQSTPEFQDIVQYLRRVKFSTAKERMQHGILPQNPQTSEETPLIRYAYIYSPLPGDREYHFLRSLIDSDYETDDLNQNGIIEENEEPNPVGSFYKTLSSERPDIQLAFSGKIAVNHEYHTDQWGTFLSCTAPLLDSEGRIFAIIAIDLSIDNELNHLENLKKFFYGVFLLVVVISLGVSFTVSRYFSRSFLSLIQGAKAISQQDYSVRIPVKSQDEIGVLSDSFNQMVDSIRDSNQLLKEESHRAKKAYLDLEASQKQLIRSDKMITLGTMVAGVAHEINTPLSAIQSNSELIGASLKSVLLQLDPKNSQLDSSDLEKIIWLIQTSGSENQTALSTKELRALKKQISQKLEELHQIDPNSIIDFIVEWGLLQALEENKEIFLDPKLKLYLGLINDLLGIQKKANVIQTSSLRVSKIVKSLKSYMHFEEKEEMVLSDLSDGIEMVLIVLHNKWKYGIEVIKKYSDIPKLYCYPDELNQIWTNLIHNSIQAMKESGTLLIEMEIHSTIPRTPDIDKLSKEYTGKYVFVSIEDSGHGIPPELRSRIFDAFFTTKPAGEGSGLGLHIIGKILEKHKGGLILDSVPGKTRFTILIPLLESPPPT
jgi:signal transduction histidine kinase